MALTDVSKKCLDSLIEYTQQSSSSSSCIVLLIGFIIFFYIVFIIFTLFINYTLTTGEEKTYTKRRRSQDNTPRGAGPSLESGD